MHDLLLQCWVIVKQIQVTIFSLNWNRLVALDGCSCAKVKSVSRRRVLYTMLHVHCHLVRFQCIIFKITKKYLVREKVFLSLCLSLFLSFCLSHTFSLTHSLSLFICLRHSISSCLSAFWSYKNWSILNVNFLLKYYGG